MTFCDILTNYKQLCIGVIYHQAYYFEIVNTMNVKTTSKICNIYLLSDDNKYVDKKIWSNTQLTQIEIKYDINYPTDGSNVQNFKLHVNDKCVYNSRYIKTFIVEYDGDCTFTKKTLVDH